MNIADLAENAFQIDFDRALAARFAPVDKRLGLNLLLIFDHQLGKIRYQTSDPLLRRIKMQFWREALADKYGSGTDLAKQLIECFAANPPMLERLEELIDVHEKFADEQNYASAQWDENNQRHSVLFKLATCFLHSTGSPLHSGETEQDRFFRNCGLAYSGIIHLCKPAANQQNTDNTEKKITQVINAFDALKAGLGDILPAARPAVLPLALVPSYLHLFEASDKKDNELIDLHPVKKTWILWRTMRRGFSTRT